MMNFKNKRLRNHGMLGNNEITLQKSLRVTRVLLDLHRTAVIQSTYFWLIVRLVFHSTLSKQFMKASPQT